MNDSLEVAQQTSMDWLNIANFVSGDSLNMVSGMGVSGDPVPDTITNSTFFTIFFLVCLITYIVSMANTVGHAGVRFRELFYLIHDSGVGNTGREKFFQLTFITMNCLMLAFFCYSWFMEKLGLSFLYESRALFLLLAAGCFALYFLVKWLIYSFVGFVFNSGKETLQWNKLQGFLWALEGVVTLPVTLLLVYFDLSIENVAILFVITLLLVKIVTFYQVRRIFFAQKSFFLQSFLYFCALEIVPLVTIVSVVVMIVEMLQTNF